MTLKSSRSHNSVPQDQDQKRKQRLIRSPFRNIRSFLGGLKLWANIDSGQDAERYERFGERIRRFMIGIKLQLGSRGDKD
jgi:hypothetical protein